MLKSCILGFIYFITKKQKPITKIVVTCKNEINNNKFKISKKVFIKHE